MNNFVDLEAIKAQARDEKARDRLNALLENASSEEEVERIKEAFGKQESAMSQLTRKRAEREADPAYQARKKREKELDARKAQEDARSGYRIIHKNIPEWNG